MFKKLVQMGIQKMTGKGKVSPTIKSVKPNLKKTVKETKQDEYRKRYTALNKAEGKIKSGKQMIKEGQKERKKMVDTGRAFQFKNVKSYHAMGPGDKEKYGASMKVAKPQKRFSTGKELEQQEYFNKGKGREKKMGGGMMGRRFGMKKGSKFPDLTGDGKVTFADILKGRGVINGKKKKKA